MAEASFRTIKTVLMRRIRDRVWAPGSTIPGEQALAIEFGWARATMNRALRELAEEGVLERRRKAGTRIVDLPVKDTLFALPAIRAQIEARGAEYSYLLLSSETATPPDTVRGRMELSRDAKALHIRCLHLADGEPYQYEDRWINPEIAPAAAGASFETEAPMGALAAEMVFADFEHTLSAQGANEAEAEALGLKSGDAVLIVENRMLVEKRVASIARFAHPGGPFRLHARR